MIKKEQNINCEIIQDMIPLYLDDVCSESTKKMVEDHINECTDCKEFISKLSNTTYENCLAEEKTSVLQNYAKKEKKRSFTIGIIMSAILMVPVIVCLICNILVGHALDWFFIVLTSLMVFASATVVPMLVSERKFLWTLGSFITSLELLLLSTCIYTGGNWFFLASVPIIFGLSVIFMPIILKQITLPDMLKNKKGLITVLWDSIWLFGIIIVCGFHTSYELYWHVSMLCTLFGLCFLWSAFLIARYIRCNKLSKSGLIIIAIGCLVSIADDVINKILGIAGASIFKADFSVWNDADIMNSNIELLIGIISMVIGIALLVIGIIIKKNKK